MNVPFDLPRLRSFGKPFAMIAAALVAVHVAHSALLKGLFGPVVPVPIGILGDALAAALEAGVVAYAFARRKPEIAPSGEHDSDDLFERRLADRTREFSRRGYGVYSPAEEAVAERDAFDGEGNEDASLVSRAEGPARIGAAGRPTTRDTDGFSSSVDHGSSPEANAARAEEGPEHPAGSVTKLTEDLDAPSRALRQNLDSLRSDVGLLLETSKGHSMPLTPERLLAMKRLPQAMDEALESADRMNGLIAALKEAAKKLDKIPTRKPAIDLNAVVLEAVARMTPEWNDCARVEYALEEGLRPIDADESSIRRAVRELVTNAAEAIREGSPGRIGRIRVVTESNRLRETFVRIEDDGPGIAPHHLDRVFEMSYTTRPGRTGVGLGVVRQIMASHDGTASVESTRRGATVELRFPRHEELLPTVGVPSLPLDAVPN